MFCDFALVLRDPSLGEGFCGEASYGSEALAWDADLSPEGHIGSANNPISRVSVRMG
jgi:hypothetical protein